VEPIEGIAVAQHRRRRVRVHSGRSERLLERLGCDRLAVAGEGETVLAALSVDHLARNHREMALVSPVPAPHVAAVETNHDGVGRLCRRLLRRLDEVLLHDLRAGAQRPIPDRARVLRPTHRQQLG